MQSFICIRKQLFFFLLLLLFFPYDLFSRIESPGCDRQLLTLWNLQTKCSTILKDGKSFAGIAPSSSRFLNSDRFLGNKRSRLIKIWTAGSFVRKGTTRWPVKISYSPRGDDKLRDGEACRYKEGPVRARKIATACRDIRGKKTTPIWRQLLVVVAAAGETTLDIAFKTAWQMRLVSLPYWKWISFSRYRGTGILFLPRRVKTRSSAVFTGLFFNPVDSIISCEFTSRKHYNVETWRMLIDIWINHHGLTIARNLYVLERQQLIFEKYCITW